MKNDYKNLRGYLCDNEFYIPENDEKNIYKSVVEDIPNKDTILFIEDHFNDQEMLKELSTGIIKDMFTYYIKHR